MNKKFLTILLVLLGFTTASFVAYKFMTTYYISTSGSDTTGDGSVGNPWKTLYKAAQSVTISGNTIYVTAGVYNETQEATISEGVNIDGAGQGIAVINNTLNSSGHYAIRLSSVSEGTNGNQYIRNITLTGSILTGVQGIYILKRSNVSIYNCTFRDFVTCAIYLEGNSSFGSRPTIYSSGNLIYNDSLINCSDRGGGGAGMIGVGGQDGLQIYNNYLNQTARATGHNGNILWAVEGFNKNLKFYGNMSIKPDTDGPTNWNFHLETWNNDGGNEFYNNTFIGGVALDAGYYFANKGSSTYSMSFHDNIVKLSTQQANSSRVSQGVNTETAGGDFLIYNNHFINIANPIELEGNPQALMFKNVFIHNNIFENCGYSDNSFSSNILVYAQANDTMRNIYIDNNTFYNTTPATMRAHVSLQADSLGIVSNIYFRNNIATNSSSTSGFFRVRTYKGLIDSLFILNNIVYGNGNSNNIYYDSNPATNVSIVNSIKSSPLMNTDFTLQSSSPARGSGTDVGFGLDMGALPYSTLIVSAGANQNIFLPTTSTTLNGSATIGRGYTATYLWSKTSGPGTPVFSDITVLNPNITALSSGTYVFRITATQSDGQIVYSEVTVVVLYGAPSQYLINNNTQIFKN